MGLVVSPLVDGKLEAWKAWNAELNGPRQSEFADFNARYGLTRHATWLIESPMGPIVVEQHEGPGAESFMPKVGASNEPFDKLFTSKIREFHGLDGSAPPSWPMPEPYTDFGVS